MNWVDLVVLVVATLAAVRGWKRGLLGQIFELGGGFIGLLLGVALGPRIASAFVERAGVTAMLLSLFAVFAFVTVGQTLGFLAGHHLGKAARQGGLAELDSSLGSAFGIVVWFVSFWLVGSLLVQGPSRSLAKAIGDSAFLKVANDVMPPPPDLLTYLQQYLNTSGFPQVFVGLPRLSEPVDLPSQQDARRAARAASNSTVRLLVEACGGIQLGSGWVVDGDSVVTNAHVVAGGEAVTVQEPSGSELTGRVALFDPRTDIAVIHVPGLTATPLSLEPAIQERGTGGATIGYPGDRDGQQVIHRAAVQNSYDATGKDIYGRRTVTREVYELRSPVRRGDSGGPFVLPDGRVAGVVFAASTQDDRIGYALTGTEVQDEVTSGAARSEPVSSGSCTR
jgi:S1-C subfamily serine protease